MIHLLATEPPPTNGWDALIEAISSILCISIIFILIYPWGKKKG